MAFIYITGAPGIGKSTIQKKLQDLGFEVYDLDNPKFGGPHNKASGKLVIIPPAEDRDDDWFDRHEWRIYRDSFEDLKQHSTKKDIIIFGVAECDNIIMDLFDKVIYLYVSDEILKNRISSRIDNDYGKNESELTSILKRKHKLDLKYIKSAVKRIDASGSIEDVTAIIIRHLN